ncbi:hypothetical protein ACE6H2_007845 [Prunus campanulata]
MNTLTAANIQNMGKNLHVVMLPWSAFGHMMPFFQLSMALAKAKVHVSYISTPKNIQRLPKISPDLQPFIHLVSIPFPALTSGFLPEGAEATVDIPFEKMDNLKLAYDLLQQPIKQFIGDQLPDWIIVDFSAHWAVEIGKEFGVPLVYFFVSCAATCVFFTSLENISKANTEEDHDVLPSPESFTSPRDFGTFRSMIAYRKHEAVDMHAGFYELNDSGISDSDRHTKILSACQAVAVRSCNEFEGEYLEAYKNKFGKLVIPTGLLPPEQPSAKREISSDGDADALPPGFVERTSEKGLVCLGWVAQMEILGHPSVGGSLFHSGWGSVIETLQFGHVLVVLPFIIDQPLNARLLVEKDLAVEVKRTEEGSFCKDDIAKTLRHAMVADEGEKLRSNARKAAKVFGDHKLHQDHYIGQFVHYLKNNVTT